MGSASENRRINIYINGKQVENNMKSIRAEYRKAQNELNKMTIGTDAYVKKSKDLKKIKGYIDQHNKGLFGASKAWAQLKSVMVGVLGANLIQSGLQKLTSFIPDLINRLAGLSDIMADVRKTSGLTDQEVKELNKEFKRFDTRTPRKELLALAVEGGRLGKDTVKDLTEFVKVADQIKVALGDDLGGNGQEAIRMVGKLTEQYRVGNEYQTEFGDSMLKMGSAINEVSASGSNQASFLIDYMRRLSGVSVQADISAASTIGYAAALDEAGQAVEVSGTTMSKVMVNMYKDTDTYAKIANLSTKEFTDLLGKDSNEAMLKFLEGLNGNNEGLGVMAKKMDNLGLDGARAITVLSALAANTDNVRKKQELANKAMEEGTSLTNEFNIKNENLAGLWDKIGKAMAKIFINSSIMDGVESLVGWMYEMVKVPLSERMEEDRVSMKSLELQIYDTNTPAKKRVKLIEQLKKEYPEYLQFIDAETVNNKDLQGALKKVNDQLINKIIIQRKQEAIDDQAQKVADATEDQLAAEEKHRKLLIKIAEKYGYTLTTNATIAEQTQDIYNKLDEKNRGKTFFRYDENALKSSFGELTRLTKVAEYANGVLFDLANNKSEFENSLTNKFKAIDKNSPFWKAHAGEAKKEEEVVVTNEDLSDKEKANLTKKWEAFKKAQAAMKKKYFTKVDSDPAFEPLNFSTPKSQFSSIFGDDKAFEAQMQKLSDQEEAKGKLLLEIDAATQDQKHQTATEKELEYLNILKAQAQQYGLDVTAINEAIVDADIKNRREKLQKAADEFGTYYGALKQVANAYFEWQNSQNKIQIDANNRKTDLEVANIQKKVEQDVLSQEQADEQIAVVKQRSREKEAKIKRDQWVKEKKAKIIMATIETALSVIKASPVVPLMIAAGIAGAAGIAVIAAQPVPEFAFGTGNAPGGQALVGEYGPEIVNLPKGSEVISATETSDLLSDANNPQLNLGDTGNNASMLAMQHQLEMINERLSNMPHIIKGDWRIDEFESAKGRRDRSVNAGNL